MQGLIISNIGLSLLQLFRNGYFMISVQSIFRQNCGFLRSKYLEY
jgi:hypothetical protein